MGVYGQETQQVQHKGPSGPSIPLGGGPVARQITRNGYCGSCLSLSGNKFMERVNTVIIIHSLQYCLDTHSLEATLDILQTWFTISLTGDCCKKKTGNAAAYNSNLILLEFLMITYTCQSHNQSFNIYNLFFFKNVLLSCLFTH